MRAHQFIRFLANGTLRLLTTSHSIKGNVMLQSGIINSVFNSTKCGVIQFGIYSSNYSIPNYDEESVTQAVELMNSNQFDTNYRDTTQFYDYVHHSNEVIMEAAATIIPVLTGIVGMEDMELGLGVIGSDMPSYTKKLLEIESLAFSQIAASIMASRELDVDQSRLGDHDIGGSVNVLIRSCGKIVNSHIDKLNIIQERHEIEPLLKLCYRMSELPDKLFAFSSGDSELLLSNCRKYMTSYQEFNESVVELVRLILTNPCIKE